jgi:hypothetical protein
MPQKGPGELTKDEVNLLVIAARLYAALRERAERPPAQPQWALWDGKVRGELVRLLFYSLSHSTESIVFRPQ